MPAVMNSMCAPAMASRMSSTATSAASRPFSGLLPAPRPLVPSWMVLCAALRVSDCASVLAQMNSTPCTLREIMCSTALPPPPPTPMTLIWVPWLNSSTSIISMLIWKLLLWPLERCRRAICQYKKSAESGNGEGSSRRPGAFGAPPSLVAFQAHGVGRREGRARRQRVRVVHQKVPTNQFLTRSSAPCIEPAFCATLCPRTRARRASSSRPITVAARVCATMSDRALV